MATVGVRELRQRASQLLRRVENGETIVVTDRGRPVAVLAPIPEAGALERLRATGDVSRPAGGLDDLPESLDLEDGRPAPSAILAELRSRER
jgi:prevent-host-death family protein